MIALILTSSRASKTFPVALVELPSVHAVPWGSVCAAGTFMIIPIILIVFALEKYIVAGLTQGALKG